MSGVAARPCLRVLVDRSCQHTVMPAFFPGMRLVQYAVVCHVNAVLTVWPCLLLLPPPPSLLLMMTPSRPG